MDVERGTIGRKEEEELSLLIPLCGSSLSLFSLTHFHWCVGDDVSEEREKGKKRTTRDERKELREPKHKLQFLSSLLFHSLLRPGDIIVTALLLPLLW
jgi:hypothetical protein